LWLLHSKHFNLLPAERKKRNHHRKNGLAYSLEMGWLSRNAAVNRVTRLGNFSSIGQLLEPNCKDEVAQNGCSFGLFFYKI
jgi:hypothetical protein